jgi:VIT1/CCC1 family predicted Fe2+/Mn2+ transporter
MKDILAVKLMIKMNWSADKIKSIRVKNMVTKKEAFEASATSAFIIGAVGGVLTYFGFQQPATVMIMSVTVFIVAYKGMNPK